MVQLGNLIGRQSEIMTGRRLMSRVMLLVWVVVASVGFSSFGASAVDLQKRISAQWAIESVYWRHRNWPSDNPGPKPALDQVLPDAVLHARVEDYLLESRALEQLWARPIRDDDLQAEVARMTASSQAPLVLQEIYAALGNDPVLVAECLARPLVADRLIRGSYARDPRYHQALRTAIEQSLAGHASVAEVKNLGGEYHESLWVLDDGRPVRAGARTGARVIRMNIEVWSRSLDRLRSGFELTAVGPRTPSGSTAAQNDPRSEDLPVEDLPVGVFSALEEDDDSFFVRAILEKDNARLRVATAVWRKRPFDDWWSQVKGDLDSRSWFEGAPILGSETSRFEGNGEDTIFGLGSVVRMPAFPTAVATGCTPDTWTAIQSAGAPSPREAHTAVWTGAEMIVWGGFNAATQLDTNTGSRYTPATNNWNPTSTTGAPDPRDTHTAVWTGTKMVVWGGGNEVFVPKDTGGRYDPTTNTWAPTASGAPSAREYHTAIWSGSKMVVWGGWDGTRDIDTGGRYDPVADSWLTTARGGSSPSGRDGHTAVWSGSRMIVWGGEDDNALAQNTGGRYDPAGNAWSATATTNAPAARWFHTAVWTGNKMIVWGGYDGTADLGTGGIYDPTADAWTSTSTIGAPAARDMHVAVWTDALSEMDVWGGQNDAVVQLNAGARYNPTTNAWTAMSSLGAPIGRRFHTAVWTGSGMIVWGGWNVTDLNTGGSYCSGACAASPPVGSSTISVSKQSGGLVSWTAVPVAAAYDSVRGLLNQLHSSGGNFTTSTQACLANDQVATSYVDPSLPTAANGYWYLVRGLSCGGAGTYNETGGSQVGSRDSEIGTSPNKCP